MKEAVRAFLYNVRRCSVSRSGHDDSKEEGPLKNDNLSENEQAKDQYKLGFRGRIKV